MKRAPAWRRGSLPTAVLALVLWPALAWADGFADLRTALARPVSTALVRGTVKVESTSRQGDDKDSDEDRGLATLDFEDGPAGLRVLYPRDLLARADQETRAREKDGKAKTPATSGMRAADASSLRALLSPVPALLALLEDCAPKGDAAEARNGQPVRHLSCEHGLTKLKGKDRKYVKTYEAKVDLWVGANGLPVACNVETKLTGRAYVVITFEAGSNLDQAYQTIGERLIIVREERRSSGAGAGEKGESRTVREIALAP